MSSEFEYDVFLSYSSKDRKIVHSLAERLKKDGLRVWLDDWVIKPGDLIPLKIQHGIEQSCTLLMCMSRDYFASEWGKLEHYTLLFRDPTNAQRRFIPLLIADCNPPDVIAQFAHIDWRVPNEKAYADLQTACLREEVETLKLDPNPLEQPISWSQVIKPINDNETEKLKLQEWRPRIIKPGQNIPAARGPVEVETLKLDPKPPEKPITLSQVITQFINDEAEKLKLQEWKPRVIKLGQNIPATGGPDDYEKGTPERKLAEFLSDWKKARPDYRTMADCILLNSGDNKNAMPARIREIYNSKHLQSFEFNGIRDTAAARTVIQTNLVYEEFGNQVGKTVEFIMMNYGADGKPAVRGPGSCWFILFWDIV